MENEKANSKILKPQYVPTAEFYSQVISCLEDYSIFTMDKELNINSWSSGSIKLFQYEPEEAMGKPFEIIFTEEDKQNNVPKVEIEKTLKDGKATDNRWHIRKDGSKFYAYGLVYPLTAENGEIIGYVKVLRDLTERKKSEKYAKDMEELSIQRESMLFVLSHDIRSLLAGIVGTSEYLKSKFDKMKPEDVKEMLEELHKSAKDELDLLDYLTEWARIKYAAEAFAPTKIELFQSVQKVFDTFKESAMAKGIHLYNKVEKNIRVFADEEMLLSVFNKLVSNSVKSIHSKGDITIVASQKDDKISIEIKDTGTGISKEVQQKLFTPQITSLSMASNYDKETGMELILAKGFVEKNGGTMWVESTEGEGSSFYFTLPIEKPMKTQSLEQK